MKKIFAIMLALVMLLGIAACGNSAAPADNSAAGTSAATPAPADTSSAAPAGSSAPADSSEASASYRIAIIQQLDHSSLDEIRLAIEAELDKLAADKGIEISYSEFNGQNDQTMLNQIAAQVVSDGYDAIIPIATLAAQSAAVATEDIPIIYAAISDPGEAGLTDIANVTGTSDALNTPFILDMMLAVNPDIKAVGLLYSNSEPNSVTPIAEAKAYLDSKGIKYVDKTGNTNDEIITAVNSMLDQVDAVFTPTDNAVMAAAGVVAEILAEAGIPHYAGADSFVTAGAFATCGVNYTELGTYTADMALAVIESGDYPEYHVMDGGIITVNTETAEAIGADYSVFSDMAGTVVEVVTEG
ncbi:MAG: ABC transporter substrate-binding protein [Butyricicoccus sp.]|nr:ABC transporter substrate-binding protein [Butyricicoccus sp.]